MIGANFFLKWDGDARMCVYEDFHFPVIVTCLTDLNS